MTYPNGRKIDYVYNTGLDATISRLSAQADDNAGSPGTTLEAYVYLGLNTIVERNHPEPNVNLTYIQQTGQSNPLTNGGDIYTGLDRFGRVIDQNWWNASSSTSTDRFQYGYDHASQVLYKNNLVAPTQSELYHASSTASGDNNTAYDLVGRLTGFARGTLSASGNNGSVLDTVASSTRSQSWSLDALGNWSSQTTNGSTTTRGFNAQNETTSVSGGTAPGYDANGNTTSDAGQTMVYDAWNRLVGVKSGSETVAAYAYDALTRRISETYSGTATTNHLYYSPQWQVIEERVNGTASSNVSFQYVWGAAYIDQMVLRDSYSGGARTLRLYVQQDANFNVTALVSTSGVVQERYLYDPYGAVTITDVSYTVRSSSSYGWIYLHQGGRQDAITGWYLFRFRDYIPGEGRWAERDLLGYGAGSLDLYLYQLDNPENGNDPSGLDEERSFQGSLALIAWLLSQPKPKNPTGATSPSKLKLGPICKGAMLGPGDLVIITNNPPGKDTSKLINSFKEVSQRRKYMFVSTQPGNLQALELALEQAFKENSNVPFRRLVIIGHNGSGTIKTVGVSLSREGNRFDITNIPSSLIRVIDRVLLPDGLIQLDSCGYYHDTQINDDETDIKVTKPDSSEMREAWTQNLMQLAVLLSRRVSVNTRWVTIDALIGSSGSGSQIEYNPITGTLDLSDADNGLKAGG